MKISIRLDTRKQRKDNTFPLKFAIHRKGRTLYLPLDIYLYANEWDKEKQVVVKRQDKKMLNILLENKLSQMKLKLLKLQELGESNTMTNVQLLDYLAGIEKNKGPHLFSVYFEKYLGNITNKSTCSLYCETKSRIQKYVGTSGYRNLTFEEITPSWLKEFQAHMTRENLKTNSQSIHFRNMRAIFNAAISDEYISNYPFKTFKIKSETTRKCAFTREQLLLLMNANVPARQKKYIDMFFLGFYLIGINIVDMSKLQYIEKGRIEYERTKILRTHKRLSIKVEPEALHIINKYKGKKSLLSFFDNSANYISVSHSLNRNLAEIGHKIGIGKFTYYACRHSWATMAAELDIPKETISLAFAHSSSNVTDVYIKPNYEKVDKANRQVIDYLLHGKNDIQKDSFWE